MIDGDDRKWAVVSHQDGSLVTPDAPARRGELLTLYGTGFGSADPIRPFGFAVPQAPAFPLSDTVGLRAGDVAVTVEGASAAPGRVGVDAIQFRIPDAVPGGAPAALVATAGTVDSNPVLLPVE